MKELRKLCSAAVLLAGATPYAWAQVPAVPAAPAAVPAVPGAVPAAPVAAPAAPNNLWSFLCMTPEQKAAKKAKFCASGIGQLFNNGLAPAATLTGGVIPQCCPTAANGLPNPADLLLPADSALGAAAKIKQDTAAAKARRAAVRYLGTVDCNYWPEAQEALVNSLRGDRNECVRLEAAWALNRGCCCNKLTIQALADTVAGVKNKFPAEDSPRVKFAAMQALEHCLECFVDIVPVPPAAVRKEEPLPEPKPIVPGEPVPKAKGTTSGSPAPAAVTPTQATAPTTEPSTVFAAYCQRVQAMSMEQIVQNARASLQKARETSVTVPASAEVGHCLVDVVRTAFVTSSDAVPADHVESVVPATETRTAVETSPPPVLQPIPMSPIRTTATEQPSSKPAPAPAAPSPYRPASATPTGPVAAPAPVSPYRTGSAAPAPAGAPAATTSYSPTSAAPAPPVSAPKAASPYGSTSSAPSIPVPQPTAFRPSPYTSSAAAPPGPSGRITNVMAVEDPKTPAPVHPAVVSAPASPAEMTTAQLLILLRESPYPSVRELSVRRLVAQGQVTMPVAEALLKGAQGDAIATVRAACLRALMKLQVTGPALLATVHQLQSDRDPRVRSAAEEVGRWLQTVSTGPTLDHGTATN